MKNSETLLSFCGTLIESKIHLKWIIGIISTVHYLERVTGIKDTVKYIFEHEQMHSCLQPNKEIIIITTYRHQLQKLPLRNFIPSKKTPWLVKNCEIMFHANPKASCCSINSHDFVPF